MRILDDQEKEQEEQHEPSRGKGFIGWVLLGLIILGGVGYWFASRDTEPVEESKSVAPVESKKEVEPPSKPIPRATTSTIEITANVDGATVYLNGEVVGKTPHQVESVEPGSHQVRIEKPGFQPFVKDIRVTAGRRAKVRGTLEPERSWLRVESDVSGATVFLDRRYVGTTPLTIEDVEPGPHELTVSADGYDMHAETVEMATGGRDLLVRFKEVKLNESIPVVHKHGFGSCKGRLVATLEGLRYESDHKDTFSVPFSRLERFEVDFIKKNLRVKVRGGRNYNFTEKSGNADALFVFHKNTESAMKRLGGE